jgi:hypothetical protein
LKLTCPKCPKHHQKTFTGEALSSEYWTMDKDGECVNMDGGEVYKPPEVYFCDVCGTQAEKS